MKIEELMKEIDSYDLVIGDAIANKKSIIHNLYYMKATALVKLGMLRDDGINSTYENALECYTKAIELSPKNPIYYSDRGKLFKMIDRDDLAMRDIRASIELSQGTNDESGIFSIYIDNAARVIHKLDSIKIKVEKLVMDKKVDSVVAELLLEGVDTTAALSILGNKEIVEYIEGKVNTLKNADEAFNVENAARVEGAEPHRKITIGSQSAINIINNIMEG